MKRIILAATVVLLFIQPAFAYSRLFYRFTVRSNYEKVELPADILVPANSTAPTDTPPTDPSTIPPAEEGMTGKEVVEEGLVEEIVAEEPGVENTPEGKEIASAILYSPEGVDLIETSSTTPPSDIPDQLFIPPVEESVSEDDLVDAVVEEIGVVNTPEGAKEVEQGEEIVVEEQGEEMLTEKIEPAQEPEEEKERDPAQPEQRITTPAEAGE